MQVRVASSYHARVVGSRLVRMPDDESVFKLYCIDIVGREEAVRYEWRKSSLDGADFEARLAATGWEGVGFITAFPHIAKVFRFAPEAETVLHVFAFDPADLAPLDLSRNPPWVEFACFAEAAIASDEYRLWAAASTVEEYLAGFSAFRDGPIARHDKLRTWCEGRASG